MLRRNFSRLVGELPRRIGENRAEPSISRKSEQINASIMQGPSAGILDERFRSAALLPPLTWVGSFSQPRSLSFSSRQRFHELQSGLRGRHFRDQTAAVMPPCWSLSCQSPPSTLQPNALESCSSRTTDRCQRSPTCPRRFAASNTEPHASVGISHLAALVTETFYNVPVTFSRRKLGTLAARRPTYGAAGGPKLSESATVCRCLETLIPTSTHWSPRASKCSSSRMPRQFYRPTFQMHWETSAGCWTS